MKLHMRWARVSTVIELFLKANKNHTKSIKSQPYDVLVTLSIWKPTKLSGNLGGSYTHTHIQPHTPSPQAAIPKVAIILIYAFTIPIETWNRDSSTLRWCKLAPADHEHVCYNKAFEQKRWFGICEKLGGKLLNEWNLIGKPKCAVDGFHIINFKLTDYNSGLIVLVWVAETFQVWFDWIIWIATRSTLPIIFSFESVFSSNKWNWMKIPS